MDNIIKAWGIFDEDDVMQDYSLYENDIEEWALRRFEGKKVYKARIYIDERIDITDYSHSNFAKEV